MEKISKEPTSKSIYNEEIHVNGVYSEFYVLNGFLSTSHF
jgi:hypothetical protein